MKTIFEKSQEGQRAYSLPRDSEEWTNFFPDKNLLRTQPIDLPEVSELDLTRHFTGLSKRNIGIDNCFYPLGSCTMKLNPRINEQCAQMPGFSQSHPYAPEDTVQGNLQIIYELTSRLSELCGMTAGSLSPNAGAQGELTGIRMIAEYHRKYGNHPRTEVLIPDNAHGTNPATAAMAGFSIVTIRSNQNGDMDLDHLREKVSDQTAALMLTNPNTLGIFSPVITEIAEIVHEHGGLLYYDGANLNPMMGIARPGDMGFDVMHLNLHKTFSTPHGGGGPGSGPVLCNERLKEFLPSPFVVKEGEKYHVEWNRKDSIGPMSTFFGNFSTYLRAYLYFYLHGFFGLRRVAELAVLNANYLKKRIAPLLTVPFSQPCMHEFVVQADNYLGQGVRALDIAKRFLDYGVHAPTVYFPLIVKECMLIEPTETESKQTLDDFVGILEKIVKEIKEDPELVRSAPHSLPVTRLDEVRAAKKPILKHQA